MVKEDYAFHRSTLFIGLNPRWGMYRFLPSGLNILYSAAGIWDERKGEARRVKFPKQSGKKFIDCGGYTLFMKLSDYPFTPENYANIVAMTQPDYFASMDYPCEPEITARLGASIEDRMEATVDMAIYMQKHIQPMLKPQMVPVIQGFTLDQYIDCIEMYRNRGGIREFMAVGSVCNRSNDSELEQLIIPLVQYATEAGIERLHFFGLKLSRQAEHLYHYIDSRDSAAVLYAATAEMKRRWNGRRWAKGQEEKREAFEYFLTKASDYHLLWGDDIEKVCPHCQSYYTHPPSGEDLFWLCCDCGETWGDVDIELWEAR